MLSDLETITDELEREATIGIIHNCELFTNNLYFTMVGSNKCLP